MASDLKRQLDSLAIDRTADASPRRWGVWLIVGLVVVVLAAVGVFALRPRAVPVRTAPVVTTAGAAAGTATVLNASGYVTARRQATVSSKITGKVVEVLIEEGMRVEEGQILARLDPAETRLDLALAEAQLASAASAMAETRALLHEAELRQRRTRELFDQAIVSPSDVDAVEAEVEALKARVAAQEATVRVAERMVAIERQNLENTVIRAPFAGITISKNAQPGEMISPMSAGGSFTRTGISTIVDMSSLEIEVDVNEAYIQRVEPDQRVSATLDAYPDSAIPGRVITTIPAAERDKATVKVRIAFDRLDPRILPDMGVKVAFLAAPVAGEPAATARVGVPRAAVRGTAGAEFVWVAKDGRLERRAVKLGPGGADPAEVLAGLTEGERVVVEGPADLVAETRVVERPSN